jgi:hypothetical protein
MKIYVAHSTSFDFKTELYQVLRNSDLNTENEIVLPHEQSLELFNSKDYFDQCDLVIAECSYHSTGMGIELGWANDRKVRIICVYKKDTKPSSSIQSITSEFIEYSTSAELVGKLKEII